MLGRPGQRSQNWVVAESGHGEKAGWEIELRAVFVVGGPSSSLHPVNFFHWLALYLTFCFLVAFACLTVSYMLYRNIEE